MDSKALMLNHGSFGAVPRPVFDAQVESMLEMEANTFLWFLPTMGYRPQLNKARRELAEYVGARPSDLVFVENASAGINAVLRSLLSNFPRGSKVLCYSFAYMMVKNTLSYLSSREDFEIVEVVIDLPTTDYEIIRKTEEKFKEYEGQIKLAILDHISSSPAMILPIKQLVNLTHHYGSLAFVDGAHALGQVPININDLNPDFYTSNGHKWLLTSKAAAFLYVKSEHHSLIHPTVISNQYGNELDIQTRFEYTGTRDYSAFLSFSSALELRRQLTDKRVMEYNNKLCLEAANKMSEAWNTTRPIPDHMTASMINVRIPCNVLDAECYSWDDIEFYLWLFTKNIWVMGFKDRNGVRYLRLSCQIYNELSDYDYLKEAIDELGTISLTGHFLLTPVKPVLRYIGKFVNFSEYGDSESPLFSSQPSIFTPFLTVGLYLLSYYISFLRIFIRLLRC